MKNPRRAAALPSVLFSVLCGMSLSGCGSTSVPATGDPALDLRHEDPRIRAQAAKIAVSKDRRDLIPRLVTNLSHPDGAVRLFSAIALRKMTGQDFGYHSYAPPDERQRAIDGWKAWISSQGLPVDDASGVSRRQSSQAAEGAAPATDGPVAVPSGGSPDGDDAAIGRREGRLP